MVNVGLIYLSPYHLSLSLSLLSSHLLLQIYRSYYISLFYLLFFIWESFSFTRDFFYIIILFYSILFFTHFVIGPP